MSSLLLSGCRSKMPAPLLIAAHTWPGYEFMFLAQREGGLDHNLVELRETKSASDSLIELAEARVDAAALTLDEVLRARGNGIPLSVVLVFDISAGADVVLSKPNIKQLGDVRGRRIGVEEGALGALMLAQFLKVAGLQRQEVTVVPLTTDQHEQAWGRGEVDLLVCYPPVATRLLETGANKLFDSRQIPDVIVDVLAVRQDALEHKGSAIRHLIATHLKQVDYLRLNPVDSSYRMAKHLNIKADDVLSSFKGMLLPSLESNHHLLGGTNPVLLASARRLLDIMIEQKILIKPDTLNGLLRADFLPESM